MLNYEVDPALLAPLVPRGTELDRWDGRALISVVGFRFLNTRVLGLSVPGHRDFEEVNLRFYVKREGPEGVRRAVVFIRELVPRRAIAWLARAAYNEPYRATPMRHAIREESGRRSLQFEWREGETWNGIRASTTGPAEPLVAGSEAEFITEHYWGYTRQRDGGTVEYRVEHPRWSTWSAPDAKVTGRLAATYGEDFGAVLEGSPRSTFVAVGSPVTVYRPLRLPVD
jgi:uncharacterized protein YqjF (DUF2071 family)